MRIYFFSFLCVFSISTFAQKKIFLDKDGVWVDKKNATQYAIETKESKDVIKVDFFTLDDVHKGWEYYSQFNKKNQLKNGVSHFKYPSGADSLVGVYANGMVVGQMVEYYPDGKKRVVITHSKNGGIEGPLFQYYPDGALRRTEIYSNGKCEGGKLFDNTGNELQFEPYIVQPEFPGGVDELMKFLSTTIKYPYYSARMGIEGKIPISFVVEKDGTITSIKKLQSVDKNLDAEAIRVVRKMSDSYKWIPAKFDGKPVRMRFTLPIVFRLGQ